MRTRESGQVLVEYLLMISIALTLVLVVQKGFRKSVFSLWVNLTREVSAACPSRNGQGCQASPAIR